MQTTQSKGQKGQRTVLTTAHSDSRTLQTKFLCSM